MKSLKQLRISIKRQAQFVDVKPYSHNIISLDLRSIAERFGQFQANKAIRDFGLDKLGWKEEKENE